MFCNTFSKSVKGLTWWINRIVQFNLNASNIYVGINAMVAKKVKTDVYVEDREVEAKWPDEKTETLYKSMVPCKFGGHLDQMWTQAMFKEAGRMCNDRATEEVAQQTVKWIDENKTSVLAVTQDKSQQEQLRDLLVKKFKMKRNLIHLMARGDGTQFTDEMVASGQCPDYKVVITTKDYCTGFSCTRCQVMICQPLATNQTTMTQLRARINRIGQSASRVVYMTVHIGLLTLRYQWKKDAAMLEKTLETFADEIEVF